MLMPNSGLALRDAYAEFDAERKFALRLTTREPASSCQAGRVLQGQIKPTACPAFGTQCTPEHPLGAPMVSSEGACAAYYRFGRWRREEHRESAR
jgi:hydrogenase expression/formation protein HypD